jgi:hypothetical protein
VAKAPAIGPCPPAKLKAAVKVWGQSGRFASISGASGVRADPVARLNLRQSLATSDSPGSPAHEASMVSGFRLASRASNLFSALT